MGAPASRVGVGLAPWHPRPARDPLSEASATAAAMRLRALAAVVAWAAWAGAAAEPPEVVGASGAWRGERVPWAGWGRGRGGRASSSCGPPCVCVADAGAAVVVDCSMALEPRAVVQGFRASPPPPAAPPGDGGGGGGDAVVRLVVMSSELPALEDDSFGNVSFTHAHVKYNHALARVSPHALRSSLATLRVLDLRNNNLTAFPLAEQLGAFRRLQYLSVDDNGVEVVPEGVSGLEQLLHLSLANNRVESLHPRALTSLPSLLHLDLHSNRLLALPPQLSALPALRSLLLWDNAFATLPAGEAAAPVVGFLFSLGRAGWPVPFPCCLL